VAKTGLWRFGLLALGTTLLGPVAHAQHVILDAPGLTGGDKKAAPPPPRAQPTVWPRLDPGAVLCATEDDLGRHAANMTARVSGGASQPADCRIIALPTGIQIISRQGLGRTEVKLKTPSNDVGWTDAWLPERAPASR
jgi:hypothetical protein